MILVSPIKDSINELENKVISVFAEKIKSEEERIDVLDKRLQRLEDDFRETKEIMQNIQTALLNLETKVVRESTTNLNTLAVAWHRLISLEDIVKSVTKRMDGIEAVLFDIRSLLVSKVKLKESNRDSIK